MHPSSILSAGAAVLLALASSASATGSASVSNNCPYTVYYMSVDGEAVPFTAMAPGGSMSQGYGADGEGTSIKIALNNSLSAPITQFEFTPAAGNINYDLSNINGDPFASGGMTVTPSGGDESSYPTCVSIVCAAGESVCTAAYNQPNDVDTMVCADTASLNLVLCPGGGAKRTIHTHHKNRAHRAAKVHAREIRHPHGRVWVSV